jgi:hypothetical protein
MTENVYHFKIFFTSHVSTNIVKTQLNPIQFGPIDKASLTPDLALFIVPNRVGATWIWRQNPATQTLSFK